MLWYIVCGLLLLAAASIFFIVRWVKKHSLWIDQDSDYFVNWNTNVPKPNNDDELPFVITRCTTRKQDKV
jgi:hypothetical protein